MTIRTFKSKLKKLILNSEEFEVDLIEMSDIRELARRGGHDDVMSVVGKDDTEDFLVYITKV